MVITNKVYQSIRSHQNAKSMRYKFSSDDTEFMSKILNNFKFADGFVIALGWVDNTVVQQHVESLRITR